MPQHVQGCWFLQYNCLLASQQGCAAGTCLAGSYPQIPATPACVPCFLQLQYSCAPLIQKNILAYTRDPAVPGVNDIVFPKTVQWNGVQYNDNIWYRDFSARMTVGENVAGAGYVVHKRGSWKVGGTIRATAAGCTPTSRSHCC